MGYKRRKFAEKGMDTQAYERYFHQNQAEYIRTKLRCVKAYSEGMEFAGISQHYGVHEQSCRKYVNAYLSGGFEGLCKETKRKQPTNLTPEQALSFKGVLLSCRPCEVGLSGNIWTGKVMCQYLLQTYGVVYQSGIYDLLERLDLSHQKAHSDYGNAKLEAQQAFIEELAQSLEDADEKTAVVKFDEFSLCNRPSSYYGWAEKNTRPKVVTDEKTASAPMAF